MFVRGFTLWAFYIPAFLVWILAMPVWPFARLLGFRLPGSLLYYVRWGALLHDALLTRLLPVESMPWPWQVDVRNSKLDPILEAH